MIISDLNHIEVVNEETNIIGGSYYYGYGGGGIYRNINLYDSKSIYVNEYFNINKYTDVNTHVKNNFASAEATGSAYGDDSFTQTVSDINVTDYSSQSISFSAGGVG